MFSRPAVARAVRVPKSIATIRPHPRTVPFSSVRALRAEADADPDMVRVKSHRDWT